MAICYNINVDKFLDMVIEDPKDSRSWKFKDFYEFEDPISWKFPIFHILKFSEFRILKSLQIFRIQDPESSGLDYPAGKSQSQ